MAGSQAYQVNFGGFVDPMRNVNDAVSGLQGAISNYGANQDKRDDRSLQALRALNKINTENEKSRILQDINKNPNEFNQVLADKQGLALSKKYDDIYNSLYEKNPLYKDGSDVEEYIPRVGKTDADNKILKDRRDRFDHGFLGVAEGQDTPLGIQTLTDNYGKAPRTAEDMSNDVYNQMLAKGYSIDDAEKARKTQLAKGAVAGPSKGILDMLKAKADIRSKLGSKQADMLAQDGLVNRMTTVSDKVSNYKNSKGKLKSPSSKTLQEATSGIDPNSGIMGFLTGGIGADKGNYVISQLVNDGYSLNQINEMMKSQEVGEWFGSQNEYDAHTSEGLYENVLNYAKKKGWNPGTPGSAIGDGGKSGSQTTYDKHYVKGTGDKVNSAFNRTINDINKMYADAGVGKSNNNPLLTNAMINDVFTLGDQKVNYADSKSNGSTKSNSKTPLLYDKSTGIGRAMSSKKHDGALLKYATQKGEDFSKEFDNLSPDGKAKVVKILESSNNVLKDKPILSPKIDDTSKQIIKNTDVKTPSNNITANPLLQSPGLPIPRNPDEEQSYRRSMMNNLINGPMADGESGMLKDSDNSPWWNKNYNLGEMFGKAVKSSDKNNIKRTDAIPSKDLKQEFGQEYRMLRRMYPDLSEEQVISRLRQIL